MVEVKADVLEESFDAVLEADEQGVAELKQDPPEGLVTVRIDPATGLLARSGQRDAIFETFPEGQAPQESSDSLPGGGMPGAGDSTTEQLF